MDIFELIQQRRTVSPNQYNKQPITEEELQKILESANWAPNHKNTEPWRFKVMRGESRLKLADYLIGKNAELEDKPSPFKNKKISSKFENSHTVIAICIQKKLKRGASRMGRNFCSCHGCSEYVACLYSTRNWCVLEFPFSYRPSG